MKRKNRDKENQIKIYIATVILSLAFIFFGNQIATSGLSIKEYASGYFIPATITQIVEKIPEKDIYSENSGFTIKFRAKLDSGTKKGIIVSATKNFDIFVRMNGYDDIEVGDKVLLYSASLNTNGEWVFMSYIRSNYLIYFAILFLVMLLVFGQMKGLNTIISLIFTILAIFAVLVPAALNGQNIYLWSIIVSLFIVGMTLMFINGADAKSLAAALGCIGGVMIAGVLTIIMDQFIHLTGVVSEESVFLLNLGEHAIDLKAVVFGAIIIGAIGAIMDVAMSIASSLYELSEQMVSPTFGVLLKSGFAIGKDIMGTMANTLILAYIGSSFALVLLLMADNTPLIYLFNREMIVVEILQALVGSFGLLFTIPFTSLVAAKLYTRR